MIIIDKKKLAEINREFSEVDLLNDRYAQIFFKNNIPCTQLMLRIIMEKPDLIVETQQVQYRLDSPTGSHYVRLDVYAVDGEGRQYDIEVQNASAGAIPQRARYNSALLDVHTLKPGENYSVLKKRENIVIFITKHDVLKGKRPLYRIERIITDTGKKFNDGTLIIYVNTSHKDSNMSDLMKLIHDFRTKYAEDMLLTEFREKATDIQKQQEAEKMKVLEEFIAEARAEGEARGEARGIAEGIAEGITQTSENIALGLIKLGQMALMDIAQVCNLTLQRVQELASQKN